MGAALKRSTSANLLKNITFQSPAQKCILAHIPQPQIIWNPLQGLNRLCFSFLFFPPSNSTATAFKDDSARLCISPHVVLLWSHCFCQVASIPSDLQCQLRPNPLFPSCPPFPLAPSFFYFLRQSECDLLLHLICPDITLNECPMDSKGFIKQS